MTLLCRRTKQTSEEKDAFFRTASRHEMQKHPFRKYLYYSSLGNMFLNLLFMMRRGSVKKVTKYQKKCTPSETHLNKCTSIIVSIFSLSKNNNNERETYSKKCSDVKRSSRAKVWGRVIHHTVFMIDLQHTYSPPARLGPTALQQLPKVLARR